MSAPPEVIHLVRQWAAKAENDLITAEHTLKLTENCPFEIVCFHAQQCAEKSLKAVLVSRSIDYPRTHDLRALYQLLPGDVKPAVDVESLLSLNRYAVESRYPGDYEPIDRKEAEQAVDVAGKIKAVVMAHLPL